MADINPVQSPASAATLREFAQQSPGRSGEAGGTVMAKDRVKISELANFLSRLAELPDARAKKVIEVRNSIANGTYETPEKLDIATERLLNELSLEG